MRLRTRVRAGGRNLNSNETMLATKKKGLKLKTRVKAGGKNLNSNETMLGSAGGSRRNAGAKARAKKRA